MAGLRSRRHATLIRLAGAAAITLAQLFCCGECAAADVDAGVVDGSGSDSSYAETGGGEVDAAAKAPATTPPRLIQEAGAVYSEEARRAGVEGIVTLAITVDVTGAVTDAQVVTSLGFGLDEAARDAALRSRFEPALRDGRPVRARIRLEHRFVLPRAPVQPSPPAAPASAAALSPVVTPPPPPAGITDVVVRGAAAAQRLRESAEAVTVVDTRRAKAESSDLAQVVSRVPGVSVQRSGALGSYSRVSINGLTDDQIRYFMDGIPLDMAGFGFGLQNTPVNFVDRVEIYRGVVPMRFGADALGGAFNLVTLDDVRGTHASSSLELGSFGTTRATLAARTTRPGTGLFTAVSAFADHADNDYTIDAQVPDAVGRPSTERVHLFHNGYSAFGGMVDVGVVDRPWAKRLILRAFANRQANDIQSNFVMSVPYGEAHYWQDAIGANVHYEEPRIAGSRFGTSVVIAYGRSSTSFQDLSPWVYDWFGQRVRARARAGEIDTPSDQTVWDDKIFSRVGFTWTPASWQEVRLALTPTFDDRSGHDHLVTMGRDPLAAIHRYLTIVAGGEYEIDLFDRRLQSIAFLKGYVYKTWSEEHLPGDVYARRDQEDITGGIGEELRYRLAPAVRAKASYERTTRFPAPDEVFGDGVRTLANLELRPEHSQNANLGLTVDGWRTRRGEVRADLNGFFRQASDLIVLLPGSDTAKYANVNTARSMGVEASSGWTSPRGWLALDGNVTWQSLRNVSSTGTFGAFDGDRIPNRPWLFANLAARLQKADVSALGDDLAFTYRLRYVHEYFRSWESLGQRQYKQVIPAQTTHDLVLTYATGAPGKLRQTWSLEADNVTDSKVYDFYGVQRPGRAFYAKVVAEF